MNDKESIISALKVLLPSFPIKKAWLFGSYATGENKANSDIDLLVTYDKNDKFTLFTIGNIIASLSDKLGKNVDVVENGRLLPFAQKSVDDTKILIYERDT